ncbi:putative GMF family protein [Coleophoma crateriformis]|uniref:Putative GMF family protein n=1 Tax=Coleophoma crateriformis TaxID=565419 RepID=A0A3D8S2M6_9HELO|nr:putative GMF family protein [Coleophoma crateriformis]
MIDYIDKNTLEIKQDEEKIVYKDLQEIADELPDHSPRYVLLSYPLTLVCLIPSSKTHAPQIPNSTSLKDPEIFSLLIYCYEQPSGRLSVPYVLLYYLPATCNAELRMLYAGAKELMRNTAEVGKVLEIDSADDLEDVPKKLGAE